MTGKALFLPIIIPLLAAFLVLLIPSKLRRVKEGITLLATLANLLVAIFLFKNNANFALELPWLGFGLNFSLKIYNFSAFIVLAASSFGFLIALYSSAFMKDKNNLSQFYSYFLITLSFTNGAVLSDNLILMLFFWEGLLLVLFGMIAIGNKEAFKTATKAFIITGVTDLCMMCGMLLSSHLAGTLTISKINLPLNALGSVAFILLMIGAISKAGSMPFHSWIPDAALDAPLPFMAFVPAALEKLLGIYFLTRISLDMFKLDTNSWLSTLLMSIGAVTILLAVMMALIQKNYKKLLSYHAVSQVGYMILGIGTAVPAGIVGGLFHMINNALYKSGLFLSAGSIEKQTGTTNLEELGGIAKRMPVTFICFLVTAVSISGVPPFNGFFSKELIYDGALERHLIFYLVAVIGSFFTAASFLKLGHAAFLGKLSEKNKDVKEASLPILFPMIIIAFFCILFGIFNSIPLNKIIQPITRFDAMHSFSGWPSNMMLVIVTLVVLFAAVLNHIYGVKKTKSALGAVDHIHHAIVLSEIYDRAEKRVFDPYEIGLKAVNLISKTGFWIDRRIDWFYDSFIVNATYLFTRGIKRMHTENYSVYLIWSLVGLAIVVVFLMYT